MPAPAADVARPWQHGTARARLLTGPAMQYTMALVFNVAKVTTLAV